MRGPSGRGIWFALLAVVVVAAVVVPVAVFATGGAAAPSARVRQWREDISYLASELPLVRMDGLGSVSRAAGDLTASRLEAEAPRLAAALSYGRAGQH